jgi:hypothetical protein
MNPTAKRGRVWRVMASAACLLAALDALGYQNEPSGFRGMPWGTPFAAVQSQMIALQGGKYMKVPENLWFAGVRLERIQYEFYDGRFDRVSLVAQRGFLQGTRLLAALKARFGEPSIVGPAGLTRVFWLGATTRIGFSCGSDQQCVALIVQHPADNAAIPQKPLADVATERYGQCLSHCTSMYIICNMGSRETHGEWVPPALRCDDNLALCKSDCKGELHRREQEVSRTR